MFSIIRRVPSYLENVQKSPRLIRLSAPSRWAGTRFVELEFGEHGTFDITFPDLCIVWALGPMQIWFGGSKNKPEFLFRDPQIFPPGHNHFGGWHGKSRNISLDISPEVIQQTLHSNIKRDVLTTRGARTPAIKHLLRVLKNEMIAACPAGLLLGETAIAQILHLLQPDDARSRDLESRSGGVRIDRARQAIEANIAGDFTLADLAKIAGMSTRHFCRAFRQTLGLSPHEYIVRRRVDRACGLILTGRHSLAEVAHIVGFANHAHMTATFRRVLDAVPSDWGVDRGQRA